MAKHRGRAQAFQALYSLSFAPAHDEKELARAFLRSGMARRDNKNETEGQTPSGFAWDLTHGVWECQKELDSAIERLSHNWSLARMGRMEQILLQMALYEILHIGTHPKIVISESMNLADEFGASTAKSFVNGILDAAAKDMNNKNE